MGKARKKSSARGAEHARAWALFQASRLVEAKQIYETICRKNNKDDGAWLMLGIIHGQLGNYGEAENCLKRSISINPRNFDAQINLGLASYCQGFTEKAIEHYKTALSIHPTHADTLVQTGNAYARLDLLTDAEEYYRRALAENASHSAAMGNLANVIAYQGRPGDAISCYRSMLQLNPGWSGMHSNLLLCMHYPSGLDPRSIYEEHRRWASIHLRSIEPFEHHPKRRMGNNRLRIGYVTPDLREHSVAYFLKPLLTGHDRMQLEVVCYIEVDLQDDTTRSLRSMADAVRSTCGLSDLQVAEMIRKDQIDILVDLAGHTENNRLPVFAYRPAPVQMTYLGYPDTTGIETIDYRITDRWADPPGLTEHLHSEELLRLEHGFLCFAPPVESTDVTPLPYDTHGYITFGSFNALTKLTPEMQRLWGRVLKELPDSRLLIKNRQLTDEKLRARLLQSFEDMGVSLDRIQLLGRVSKVEHMATYGRVDIALDSYPYNGTTTTCDTLWMGLPVVTLAGATHVSRAGASLLTRVGLEELVAENEQQYVEIAVALAANPKSLRALRIELRERMRQSGLCEADAFCRQLETLYREAWSAWCDGKVVN